MEVPLTMKEQTIILKPGGPPDDPSFYLKTYLDLWGCTFLVEAYRVKREEKAQEDKEIPETVLIRGQKAKSAVYDDVQVMDYRGNIETYRESWQVEFLSVQDAFCPIDGFRTVLLNGEPYAIFVSPLGIDDFEE